MIWYSRHVYKILYFRKEEKEPFDSELIHSCFFQAVPRAAVRVPCRGGPFRPDLSDGGLVLLPAHPPRPLRRLPLAEGGVAGQPVPKPIPGGSAWGAGRKGPAGGGRGESVPQQRRRRGGEEAFAHAAAVSWRRATGGRTIV